MKFINLLIAAAFVVTAVVTLSALRPAKMSSESIPADTVTQDKEKHMAALMEMIKGKEQLPADSVFKNITLLKGMPAARMLRIMDVAFSKSLGVSCGHCHDTKSWESEEKAQKQIAREMWKMSGTINRDLLKSIEGLEKATINCTTCHRGQVTPALSLD